MTELGLETKSPDSKFSAFSIENNKNHFYNLKNRNS